MNGLSSLFLSLFCGVCLSEVTQSTNQSGVELTDTKIHCKHDIPDGNYDSIYWYYRKASMELTYIIHNYRGERNSGRYRIYVHRANSSSILTIRTLQLGDEAIYYCALQHTVVHLLQHLNNNPQ
uniref:Immunoglobulin V-set domain-containing protein n=1 Tax=Pelusios castaneus TaxID=367368 RepID=A0A8C8RP64_9SAUR